MKRPGAEAPPPLPLAAAPARVAAVFNRFRAGSGAMTRFLTVALAVALAQAVPGGVALAQDAAPPQTPAPQIPAPQTATPQTPVPPIAPVSGPQTAPDAAPQGAAVLEAPLSVLPSLKPHRSRPLPGLAGPYLAARQAAMTNDFVAASTYYDRALRVESDDPVLQDSAMVALISSGRVADAVKLARELTGAGDPTALAALLDRVQMAKDGAWDKLAEALRARPDATAELGGAVLDGMMRGWALMGAGKASEAFATFEKIGKKPGADGMANYHLGLAKASVGDYEAAEKLLARRDAGTHLLGVVARAQILSQMERNADAIKLIDALDGVESEPSLVDLRARLAKGEHVPFTAVKAPTDGMAQVLLTFSLALAEGDDPDPLALIHARLAAYLAPDLGEARLIAAQLLQRAGQFDLAEVEFDALRQMGDARPAAELARIDALVRAERSDDALKAAQTLTAERPDLAAAWVSLGDLLRQTDRWAEAITAYDRALSLLDKDPDPQAKWFPLYARGIALERSGQFDRADADMQAALKLQPDQAPILNYLGYSWVDRNVRLEEGLALIQKAVRLRPDDGYILDSLAWAYYRMGRYADAVAPMERAVSAMSDDSLVNDHMGDIYWRVGRKREAEIQWRRALSLWTEKDRDTNPDRIRAKLEVGLDAVLEAEAAHGGKLPQGFGLPPAAPAGAETATDPTPAPATDAATDGAPDTAPDGTPGETVDDTPAPEPVEPAQP